MEVTACPKAQKIQNNERSKKKVEQKLCKTWKQNLTAQLRSKTSVEVDNSMFVYGGRGTVTGVRRPVKDVEKVCGRKKKTDVFQGREVQMRKGSQEIFHAPYTPPPTPPPNLTLPPPSMWYVYAWVTLSYLGDKNSLYLSLPQFYRSSPASTLWLQWAKPG